MLRNTIYSLCCVVLPVSETTMHFAHYISIIKSVVDSRCCDPQRFTWAWFLFEARTIRQSATSSFVIFLEFDISSEYFPCWQHYERNVRNKFRTRGQAFMPKKNNFRCFFLRTKVFYKLRMIVYRLNECSFNDNCVRSSYFARKFIEPYISSMYLNPAIPYFENCKLLSSL